MYEISKLVICPCIVDEKGEVLLTRAIGGSERARSKACNIRPAAPKKNGSCSQADDVSIGAFLAVVVKSTVEPVLLAGGRFGEEFERSRFRTKVTFLLPRQI